MFNGGPSWTFWSFSRTHAANLDPDQVEQSSKAFGSAVRQCKQVTLLAQHCDDGSLATSAAVLSKSVSAAQTVASTCATSVDATVTQTDTAPVLTTDVLGVVRQNARSSVSRNNAAGANPGDIARAFAANSSPGDWVAMTLVPAKSRQVDNYRRWVKLRSGADSHYSTSTSLLVGSVMVGGTTRDGVRSCADQVMGMLPGFDVETSTVIPGTGALPWVASVAGVAAWGGLAFGAKMPDAGAMAGAALAVPLPASLAGVIPTPASRLRKRLDTGVLPPPKKSTFASREERTNNNTGKTTPARLRYPLAPTSFLLTPVMAAGIVAPSSESGSGAVRAATRDVPVALRTVAGPLIGHDEKNHPAHIDARRLFEGVGVIGTPGSGKSVALRVCLAWNIAERLWPSGAPGAPGTDNAIIVFENKGADGAQHCLDYATTLGDDPLLVDLADPDTLSIDMFAFPGSLSDRCTRFIEAMKYAFTDGAIGDRAIETLHAVLPGALLLAEHGEGSVMDIAHTLAGGSGDTLALAQYAKLNALATEGDGAAAECVAGMSILFGTGITPAARRTQSDSSRNKLDQLRRLSGWWNPDRARVAWHDILTAHEMVVINLGSSMNPDVPSVSGLQTERMSSMLMFTLREAIQGTCNGWREAGRSVSVFADELSLLAGTSPDVITALRDQLRSAGVRCYFGTQYPNQLDPKVRETLLGFSTMMWFVQNAPDPIRWAVDDLTIAGHEWTGADIGAIPNHHAALRTRADDARQSPCLVKIGYWEDDLASFAADQGYDDTATPQVVDRPRAWSRRSKVEVNLSKSTDVPQEAPADADRTDPNRFG